MNDSRTRMLAAIRNALGRGPLSEAARGPLVERLNRPPVPLVPARGRVERNRRAEVFVEEAERVNATTARLSEWREVPAAVAGFLRAANLPMRIRASADPEGPAIPWTEIPALTVETGPVRETDSAGFTIAFAGIAETGTVMVQSSPGHPTLLNFLPQAQIVALPVSRIDGTYEESWERIRSLHGRGMMPRTVNWITGPSRTADIEQTLLLGAHGPQRLHVLMIDGQTE